MARTVLHLDAIEAIDTEPIMRKLAEAIAADARRNARKGKTLGLSGGIRVESVTARRAVIVAEARNPRSSPEHAPYPFWVEKGTRDTRAQPFMRPAAYRYRT